MQALKSLFLAFGLLLAFQVNGTDGYFSIGYGPYNKSLAGAGVSMFNVSLIGANPAGNAFLDKGYMIGLSVFSPVRSFDVIGAPSGAPNSFGLTPGRVESDSELFLIPAIGANWLLNDKSAIGAAIYGNGGMNTDYPAQVFYDQSSESTGVNLAQMFVELTYALQFAEGHAIGISGVLAYQYFEAKGLNTFGQYGMSGAPDKLSNNGKDNGFGYGFKVGYQGEIVDGLRLGAQFQSKMYMSEFEDYAGLFAEDGDFDIPMSWTVGLSYAFNDDWTVMADFKQIMYSDVNAVGNPMNPMTLFPGFMDADGVFQPNPAFLPLGDENGAGFGWEDMSVIKFALQYEGLPDWSFRAGYSYGKQPIPEEEVLFNILAPGVIEHHVTLGASRGLGQKNSQVHFSFHYALNNTVSGLNPLDPVQSIELSLKEFEFDIGISF